MDDFGFDADLNDNVILPVLRPLYEKWFRTEAIGLHNVPDVGGALVVANHSGTLPLDALMTAVGGRHRGIGLHNVPDVGGALVVANHSGTLPLDALMTAVALHDDHPGRRHLRMLGADLCSSSPVVGPLARKHGATLACNPDAERLMSTGELVGVWPEGFKGIGKPFNDRYKLQRFGRGGFVDGGAAHPGADHPVLDRRRRGDLPEDRRHQAARPPARRPLLPGHADVPAARPARAGAAAVEVADRVRRAHPHRHDQRDRRRRPDDWSSTSPTRCARPSSTRSTGSCHSAETRSSARGSSIGVMALPYAHDIDITVRVNGRAVRAVVHPRTTLLDWLREEVGLTGTKKGCNEGACGTCTVLVDGQPHERLPHARRAVRRPRGHHRRRAGRRTASCTRCSGPSATSTPSSAATAPPASSSRRWPASPRATPPTRPPSASG